MAVYKPKGNQEAFLVNPHGKRVGRKKNSWSGQRGKHKRAAQVGWSSRKAGIKGFKSAEGGSFPSNPEGKKKNPLLILGNSKGEAMAKKRNSSKRRSKRRSNPVTHHRRHRRSNPVARHARRHRNARRRNPVLMGITMGDILAGGASALLTVTLPEWLKTEKPLTRYGVKIGNAIAGKIVLDKMLKTGTGGAYLLVGLGVTAADAAKEFIFKKVELLTHMGPVQIPQGTPLLLAPETKANVQNAIASAQAQGAAHPAAANPNLQGYLSEMDPNYMMGTMFNQ